MWLLRRFLCILGENMLWFFFKMVMCIFGEKGMMGNLDMVIGSEYFFKKKYWEVIIDLKKKNCGYLLW